MQFNTLGNKNHVSECIFGIKGQFLSINFKFKAFKILNGEGVIEMPKICQFLGAIQIIRDTGLF